VSDSKKFGFQIKKWSWTKMESDFVYLFFYSEKPEIAIISEKPEKT
jgi:hypothetical protein